MNRRRGRSISRAAQRRDRRRAAKHFEAQYKMIPYGWEHLMRAPRPRHVLDYTHDDLVRSMRAAAGPPPMHPQVARLLSAAYRSHHT